MRKHHGSHTEMSPKTDYLNRLGYEDRDVALPALVKWWFILAAFIVGMFVISFLVYRLFVPDVRMERNRLPLTMTPIQKKPPAEAPILQVHPKRDMVVFRRDELKYLNSYGWVDESKGIVRIPIDRAMELTAERGLSRAGALPAAGSANAGVVAPGPRGFQATTPGTAPAGADRALGARPPGAPGR